MNKSEENSRFRSLTHIWSLAFFPSVQNVSMLMGCEGQRVASTPLSLPHSRGDGQRGEAVFRPVGPALTQKIKSVLEPLEVAS